MPGALEAYTVAVNAPLVAGATLTLAYAPFRGPSSYALNGEHRLTVGQSERQAPADFTLAFGASEITLTVVRTIVTPSLPLVARLDIEEAPPRTDDPDDPEDPLPTSLDLVPDGVTRVLLSRNQRDKLDGIEDGAQVNPQDLDDYPDGFRFRAVPVLHVLKVENLPDPELVVPASQRGIPGGVAPLNEAGQVPASHLPRIGGIRVVGGWNALTNAPYLSDATDPGGPIDPEPHPGSWPLPPGPPPVIADPHPGALPDIPSDPPEEPVPHPGALPAMPGTPTDPTPIPSPGALPPMPPAPPSRPATQPVSWWLDRMSASSQFNEEIRRANTADSACLYQASYGIGGFVCLAEATLPDTTFLDYAYRIFEAWMNSSSVRPSGYRGWIGTHTGGCGTVGYYGAEAHLNDSIAWRHAAVLVDLPTPSSFASRRQAVIDFLETNIFEKWYNAGVNSNMYRPVMHIVSHNAMICLVGRNLFRSATNRSRAQTVLDTINHLGMPNYASRPSIRSRIIYTHKYAGENAAWWPAYWPGAASGADYIKDQAVGGDLSHAEAVVGYIWEAIKRGYGGWTYDHLVQMAKTFKYTWPSRDVRYYRFIGPPDNTETWPGGFDGWRLLGAIDPALQVRFEGFIAPSSSARAVGRSALAARRLSGG